VAAPDPGDEAQRAKAELEEFAHAASHDLQAPLRVITGYAELLRRRYADRLDAQADEFIGYILDGSTRMQQMIQGLLAWSRAGRSSQPFRPVDCNVACDRALKNLRFEIEASRAEVVRGELPEVPADEAQLVELFQHLIANAVKFKRGEPPRFAIEAERRGTDWWFTVRDNGLGIDPQWKERLFRVFQRLHGPEEYPGIGIGLALCKRIVERHRGRIGFESVPGEGTSFVFSLPSGQGAGRAP
jgi:light-regulated signal transduction histidine kinase (bacteriophytochrome)